MKLKSLLSISAALYLAMFSLAHFGVAQVQEIKPEPPLVRQMLQEGWQKVAEGVLQRSVGGDQVETFTYGEEGLRYTLESLKEQVNSLQQIYNQHPSAELAQTIDTLQGQIAVGNTRLSSGQVEEPVGEQIENCDISYGAHAYADPLTGSQAPGVTARSDAYFHNNCGFLGNTYAYAYVQGAIGTVFTTKTQEDPKYGGTWLDSAAQLSLSASSNCQSNSYARAWSDALGISYETSAINYACPPPPLTVSISGTANVYTDNYNPCADVTWTATASGGTPGYSYNWYIGGVWQGSGSQLTKQYCYTNATVTVTVQAVDSGSPQQSAQASYTTNIYYTNYDPCVQNPYSCECDPSYCNECYQEPGMPRRICPY